MSFWRWNKRSYGRWRSCEGEREARAAAEAEAAALREQLDALTSASNAAQEQITTLNQERESVRVRVEKMLSQIDELL